MSATLMLNISETKLFSGLCPTGTLQESAQGASISDVIDDVTYSTSCDSMRLVILMTSQSFFKVVAFGN